jgi:hypothetical protein
MGGSPAGIGMGAENELTVQREIEKLKMVSHRSFLLLGCI